MPEELTVLTAADPSADVMAQFSRALAQQAADLPVRLIWMVVDGLHAHAGAPDFLRQPLPFAVSWLTPDVPLPQLATLMQGLQQLHAGHPLRGPVIVMDPDMVDNVADLPRFITAHETGAAIVFGWRIERRGIHRLRRLLTARFNVFAAKLLALPLHDLNTPMVSFTPSALACLLDTPAGCPSPRLHAYHRLRDRLDEVPIRVRELPGRKSAYTLRHRIGTGIRRVQEVLAFRRYRQRRQNDLCRE
ncbi:MAG: hypothetical protein ACOY33_04790 [Pseudomonadota bacterium]